MPLRESYEDVAYPSYALPQTHPDRLATLAALFGMNPAPVERCRVLELGCGDGGNLIPMAYGLPGSQLVGLDAAERPILKAQAAARELGLSNVQFRQQDIREAPACLGQFDYIIAYGLYSWVPPPVRDKLLAIAQASLAPDGVALVSYNAHPGGHLRAMIREMMMFHIRNLDQPEDQISQSRALLELLASSQPDRDPYGMFLKKELERQLERQDAFLYHDELAETFFPVYFHEFVEHAARHGFQYLAEADFADMHPTGAYSPAATELLETLSGEPVLREQYLDFLKCRKFRQTLLCHREVQLDRALKPEQIGRFFVASPLKSVSAAPEIRSESPEEFRGPEATGLVTPHPVAKAALVHLSQAWPRSLGFDELLGRIRASLGPAASPEDQPATQQARALGEILLRVCAAGLAELHVHRFEFAGEAGERPAASPVARLQVRSDSRIATLRHTTVRVEDALAQQLLLLLDGTRDRAALRAELTASASRDVGAEELEAALEKLARFALLVA